MLCTMFVTFVSADDLKADNAIVYKISKLDGSKDPYLTGTENDNHLKYWTYGCGSMKMDGSNVVFVSGGSSNIWEAVLQSNEWCVPVQEYSFLKIRYKTNKAAADGQCTYWQSGNGSSFKFDVKLNGEWQEAIIDLNAQAGFVWKDYCDDGAWDGSVCKNEPKIRSFRFDFPVNDGLEYAIDYVAYFKDAETAARFDGTAESLVAPVEVPEDQPAADKTADTVAIVVLAAVASFGIAYVAKKH